MIRKMGEVMRGSELDKDAQDEILRLIKIDTGVE